MSFLSYASGNWVDWFFSLNFVSKRVSTILVPLSFHIHFRIFIFIDKNLVEDFNLGIALILYIKWERIDIFTMLSLEIHF